MTDKRAKPFARTRKSVDQTVTDIQKLMKQYGAVDYGYQERGDVITIECTYEGFRLRFMQEVPAKDAPRRWRIFHDRLRSNLVAITEGVIDVIEAFGWEMVDPETGKTTGELVRPKLESYRQVKMLPGGDEE